jgi:hypothetical protein
VEQLENKKKEYVAIPKPYESPVEVYSFSWLDGDTDLEQEVEVPSGMITRLVAYDHTQPTNFEDFRFRVKVDNAIIVPTRVDLAQGARHWIHIPVGDGLDIGLSYPITEGGKIQIEVNAAPGNGFQALIMYQPMPIERKGQKHVYRHRAEELEREV